MRVELERSFRFEAAHRLPHVPPGHKCARLHGHSFVIKVAVEGEVEEPTGWLLDFGHITLAVEPVRLELDHYYLNDVPGLENPTSEHLAAWIWARPLDHIPGLSAITVEETCTSRCTYRGA